MKRTLSGQMGDICRLEKPLTVPNLTNTAGLMNVTKQF